MKEEKTPENKLREFLLAREFRDTQTLAKFYIRELCALIAADKKGTIPEYPGLYLITDDEALEMIGGVPERYLKDVNSGIAFGIILNHCVKCKYAVPAALRLLLKGGRASV